MNPQVVVIGGGISGLACAYRFWQLGVPVILLEADDRVGGLVGTVELDGFLFETGPQSFQGTDSVLDLVRELGLEVDLCQADPRAPRYVVRHGRLRELPMSPQGVLRSQATPTSFADRSPDKDDNNLRSWVASSMLCIIASGGSPPGKRDVRSLRKPISDEPLNIRHHIPN